MIEVHGYTEQGQIEATIDGMRWVVPDVPENRERQMIAEWEALGNTIPAYVPVPPPTNEEMDTETLASAMLGGKVEKAVAEVMRNEINIVRAALPTPLPARTKAQMNAALKTAMRNGA